MIFAIILGICIFSFIVGGILWLLAEKLSRVGTVRFWDGLLLVMLIIFSITFLTSVIWGLSGGFNYIKCPEFKQVIVQTNQIQELDNKNQENYIHDVAYIDSDKCIIYIDSYLKEQGWIHIFNDENIRIETYNFIPKNNLKSVDLRFNRHYEYKVFVPDGYKVVPIRLK